MVKLNDVYRRVEDDWVSRFIMDEVVIMPLCRSEEDIQYIYSISNETGSRIWQLLDGKHSVRDIHEILKSEYQGESEVIEREVLEFIGDLFNAKLIEKSDQEKSTVHSPQSIAKKKIYKSPEITKVKMQPEQAVLTCCTVVSYPKEDPSYPGEKNECATGGGCTQSDCGNPGGTVSAAGWYSFQT